MLRQFPVPHPDELLSSILARFVTRQGITEDKVALDLLFDSRLIVPSALFQGHVHQLLKQVGHLWPATTRQVIESHSPLPLFRPFVGRRTYEQLVGDLSGYRQNHSLLRTGVNASILLWSVSFKICPLCWHHQSSLYGYAFWQRLFQCPGVECCPLHGCLLLDTKLPMQSEHRHHLVGTADMVRAIPVAGVMASDKQIRLAKWVQQLLNPVSGMPDVGLLDKWSCYYHRLATELGFAHGHRIHHQAIHDMVTHYWGLGWLEKQGLGRLTADNDWLTMIFRKHRRPFSYLQHLVCWCALKPELGDIKDVFQSVATLQHGSATPARYHTSKDQSRCVEYRTGWLSMRQAYPDLKKIRANREGARLYSWLYRYDHQWLQVHKPVPIKHHVNQRVDWKKRDLSTVRRLLAVESSCQNKLEGPRRSRAWFSNQIGVKGFIDKKLHKLPLCQFFFDRYSESVDEYQTRRLACVMDQLIDNDEYLRPICEIERIAGLSRQRCRKPAREILRLDIPAWQRAQALSYGETSYSNRPNQYPKDTQPKD